METRREREREREEEEGEDRLRHWPVETTVKRYSGPRLHARALLWTGCADRGHDLRAIK